MYEPSSSLAHFEAPAAMSSCIVLRSLNVSADSSPSVTTTKSRSLLSGSKSPMAREPSRYIPTKQRPRMARTRDSNSSSTEFISGEGVATTDGFVTTNIRDASNLSRFSCGRSSRGRTVHVVRTQLGEEPSQEALVDRPRRNDVQHSRSLRRSRRRSEDTHASQHPHRGRLDTASQPRARLRNPYS